MRGSFTMKALNFVKNVTLSAAYAFRVAKRA